MLESSGLWADFARTASGFSSLKDATRERGEVRIRHTTFAANSSASQINLFCPLSLLRVKSDERCADGLGKFPHACRNNLDYLPLNGK